MEQEFEERIKKLEEGLRVQQLIVNKMVEALVNVGERLSALETDYMKTRLH